MVPIGGVTKLWYRGKIRMAYAVANRNCGCDAVAETSKTFILWPSGPQFRAIHIID
jgi:hypothetical protein